MTFIEWVEIILRVLATLAGLLTPALIVTVWEASKREKELQRLLAAARQEAATVKRNVTVERRITPIDLARRPADD